MTGAQGTKVMGGELRDAVYSSPPLPGGLPVLSQPQGPTHCDPLFPLFLFVRNFILALTMCVSVCLPFSL